MDRVKQISLTVTMKYVEKFNLKFCYENYISNIITLQN